MPSSSPNVPQALHDYLLMWNERDMDKMRAHLDRCVAPDCLWVDPLHDHTGRDALEANVGEFRTSFPNAELTLGSEVDSHHGRHRYEWVITNGDEVLLRGFDVATVNEAGLIERVDGFFGTLERSDPR